MRTLFALAASIAICFGVLAYIRADRRAEERHRRTVEADKLHRQVEAMRQWNETTATAITNFKLYGKHGPEEAAQIRDLEKSRHDSAAEIDKLEKNEVELRSQ